VVSGAALALGAGASLWLGPATPLPAVLGIYLLFGIFQGTIKPPITNTAVAGMPASMAGVAASLASSGRQIGITLGIAIYGNDRGIELVRRRDGVHQRGARRVVAVAGARRRHPGHGLLSTGRWALNTNARAATCFEGVCTGAAADTRHAPSS